MIIISNKIIIIFLFNRSLFYNDHLMGYHQTPSAFFFNSISLLFSIHNHHHHQSLFLSDKSFTCIDENFACIDENFISILTQRLKNPMSLIPLQLSRLFTIPHATLNCFQNLLNISDSPSPSIYSFIQIPTKGH